MTPRILLPWMTVAWLSARSPEMNQLCEVSAGIVNQNAGMSASPRTVSSRIAGTARHDHTAYMPENTHTSGRPSDASTNIAHASRGRRDRWQSMAARQSSTISGSELAISTRCEYVPIPSTPTAANAPAIYGANRRPGAGPVIRNASRAANTALPSAPAPPRHGRRHPQPQLDVAGDRVGQREQERERLPRGRAVSVEVPVQH